MIYVPYDRHNLKMSLRIHYITLVEARRLIRQLKAPQLCLFMNIYLIGSTYDIPHTTEPTDGVYTSLATADIYTSTSHI